MIDCLAFTEVDISPFQGLANAIAREERRMEVKTNTVMQVAYREKISDLDIAGQVLGPFP